MARLSRIHQSELTMWSISEKMQGLVQDYQGIQLDRFFGLTVEGIKLRNSTMVVFLNSQLST